MYMEIQGALSSASAALDLVKSAKGVVDQAKIAMAIQDISSRLLETQGAALKLSEEKAALQQRVADLEQRIRTAEQWDSQAEQYELRQIASGVFARAAKGDVTAYGQMVKYCDRCFGNRKLSVLQQHGPTRPMMTLRCNECMSDLSFVRYTV